MRLIELEMRAPLLTYPLHTFTAVGRAAMRRSSTNSGRLLTTSRRVRRAAWTARKTSQPRATSAMVERARRRWMSLASAEAKADQGKYGEPKDWDGFSSLFVALARRYSTELTAIERDWLRVLLSDDIAQ